MNLLHDNRTPSRMEGWGFRSTTKMGKTGRERREDSAVKPWTQVGEDRMPLREKVEWLASQFCIHYDLHQYSAAVSRTHIMEKLPPNTNFPHRPTKHILEKFFRGLRCNPAKSLPWTSSQIHSVPCTKTWRRKRKCPLETSPLVQLPSPRPAVTRILLSNQKRKFWNHFFLTHLKLKILWVSVM